MSELHKNMEWGCCGVNNSNDDFIECKVCGKAFHIACVTSSEAKSCDEDSQWSCPMCSIKRPKGSNNDNTPVRFNPNITLRSSKRPALQSPPKSDSGLTNDDVRSIVQDVMEKEMNALLSKLNTSLGAHLARELKCIKEEIKDMKDSMNFMNEKYEEVLKEHSDAKNKIAALEEQNSNLNSIVKELNSRLNSIEQNARSNNVEIQCVPERKDENLSTIIGNLSGVVNCKVGKDDISYCTRVAKMNRSSDRPRSIVVQFKTTRTRDEFMAAVIKFNKNKSLHEKLNTTHIGISGQKAPIFVMDHLSPSNRALHAATRITAKERGYKYVWIRKGLIHVRKTDDSNFIIIRDMNSLMKLK